MKDFLDAAAAAFLPQDCLLCAAPAGADLLCAACADDLPAMPAACCPVCALPTPGGAVCGACLKKPPHFDATRAAYAYDFPLDRIVQALKYHGRLATIPFLARALLACTESFAQEIDLLIPLPLHPARLRQRGFNQATELARVTAKELRLPLDYRSCERIHDSAPQASLAWDDRRRNVRGAFLCSRDLSGLRVATVDDVMTTGASLEEFARTLKKAGAIRVSNLVVARTL